MAQSYAVPIYKAPPALPAAALSDVLRDVWRAPVLRALRQPSPLLGLLPAAYRARSQAHAALLSMGRWLDDIDADVVVRPRPFDWQRDGWLA